MNYQEFLRLSAYQKAASKAKKFDMGGGKKIWDVPVPKGYIRKEQGGKTESNRRKF